MKNDTAAIQTFDATAINIYKMPGQGDKVRFADDSIWTIKMREGMKWGLYADNNVLHSAIGLWASMNDFCSSINAQADFVARTVLMERVNGKSEPPTTR
jgi:hypothetical protein